MRLTTLIGLAIALTLFLVSCGGGQSIDNTDAPQASTGRLQDVLGGPGMPQAAPDDFDVDEDSKTPSNTYFKFFADSVNQHSVDRWTVNNNSGVKQWTLSNTFNSSPKAWVMGANCWRFEADELISNSFIIPDNTDGIRLTFHARWQAAPGDQAAVGLFIDGGIPLLITGFSGGSNPSYPGWDKYYFELPPNFSGLPQVWNIDFGMFTDGDNSIITWGFGVDNVAVYQRQLEAPLNVVATDGLPTTVTVTWDPNDAGTLQPDEYVIYRGSTSGGPYIEVGTVPYGTNTFDDNPPLIVPNFYVVQSRKTGWPNSPNSNEDLGFAF